ncbi:MAG: tRNA (adenosine(37)-N6)-dimethylallyltransferase MiaA [Fuerstiella sp.]
MTAAIPAQQLKQCWFLAGPTAGGKSAAALHLAGLIDGEILSMDSMAVYRGMDIGTAKASADERAVVPHHLLDLVNPAEAFSVTDFLSHASEAVDDVLRRGKTPLFVGGTGLYLRSLLRGVFQGPEADWNLRTKLQQQIADNGPEWAHRRLAEIDPASAKRLHPNDTRRIIRAIEVFDVSGVPLSQQQVQQALPPEAHGPVVWIDPPREWLHDRINRRVDQMMQQGLLSETRTLLQSAPPPSRTARQALGYRELIQHLEDGVPLEQAVEQIKVGTRQFAKRQCTWFRNLAECRSCPISGNENAQQVAEQIFRQFG